jgi:hypothetical protein
MSDPCMMQDTILKHAEALGELHGVLSGLAKDVSYIRQRVDNGLSVKINQIKEELTTSIAEAKVSAESLKSENWFNRILQNSAAKLIGMFILFVALNALASSGMVSFLKSHYSEEPPGQQKEILKHSSMIPGLMEGYHTHDFIDGRVLFHSGDETKPAWIYDPKTYKWENAPLMRTEKGLPLYYLGKDKK